MQPELIGGRYHVISAIGQGGMGTVWLCRDETLHREVAVKQVGLLPGESVTDSARAFREARSSAALSHRNVVTVFDVIEENGAIWLVMEHVPGRSLSDLIRQEGPLDPAEVADIGAQVADGLVAAHGVGTMHRDVKPGNVLVREDGVAKISDFGIARTAGDPALTQSGFLTGTPSYFSPELARGAEPGPGTDVWALGATLYAAVEGRSPYEQRTNPVAVLHDITSGQPPRPRRAEFLEPALRRMMDRNPDSRWSMADAAHGLHRLADAHRPEQTRHEVVGTSVNRTEEPASARAPTRTPAPAPVAAPKHEPKHEPAYQPAYQPAYDEEDGGRRRHGLVYAVLAAAALLIVLGGIAYVASQRGDDPRTPLATGGQDSSSSTPSKSAAPSNSESTNSESTNSAESSDSESAAPESSASGGSSTASPEASSSSGPTTGRGAKAAFLRGYFQAAPGGTDEAWAMLGPGEQAQGRGSYDGFWRTISSVEVSDINPVRGTDSVELTLTYRLANGGVSTERQRLDLVPSADGGYLIDNDDVIG